MTQITPAENENSDKVFLKLSYIFNILVVAFLVYAIPLSYVAGVAAKIMVDSINGFEVGSLLTFLGLLIRLAMPFIMAASIIASFYCRKKSRFFCAMVVQIIPILYGVIMLGILVSTL